MQKKIIALAIAALFVAACASVGQVAKTPAQIAADVCPSVQAVVAVLSVPGAVDPAVEADLLAAGPVISAVCNGGDLVQLADLRNLSANAVPALLKVIQWSPLPPADKQAATLGIAVAQALLAPVLK
ncbi:MAG: hypothetical protein ABFC42_09150 [Sulfuricella sp.]